MIGLSRESLGSVTTINMNLRLIDIYVVNGRPNYRFSFMVWVE
jgi:hypothetical protein